LVGHSPRLPCGQYVPRAGQDLSGQRADDQESGFSAPKRVLAAPDEAAQSLQRAHDLWQQRKERVKESEFVISERIMRHAESMPEDQLINKADKIKIGVDMGRRSVGLDSEEKSQNAVNIAILGEVDARSLAGMSYEDTITVKPVPEP